MLYPFTFHPIYQERIWGGRNFERIFARTLPSKRSIGESWEISDRPEAVSVIANGPLAGKDLRWLMENKASELLGQAQAPRNRFPLLIKLLDANQTLSLQVHPPDAVAAQLGGEPKAEMWYIAEARPGAELYVGLRRGVTRSEFERRLADGNVAECFHLVRVRAGDAMYLPSGRVHAIGGGIVLFEIQENSDTTYRVFDWNRVDATGKPRDLHIPNSLASINFEDFEPELVATEFSIGPIKRRLLTANPSFEVQEWGLPADTLVPFQGGQMQILGLVIGSLAIEHGSESIPLASGQFSLIPASVHSVALRTTASSRVLMATLAGRPGGCP